MVRGVMSSINDIKEIKSAFRKDMLFLFPDIKFDDIEKCIKQTSVKTGYSIIQVSIVVLICSYRDYFCDIFTFFGNEHERDRIINYLLSRIEWLATSGGNWYFCIPKTPEEGITSFSEEFQKLYLENSEKLYTNRKHKEIEMNVILYNLLMTSYLEDLELSDSGNDCNLLKEYFPKIMASRLRAFYKLIGSPKSERWCKHHIEKDPYFLHKAECHYEVKHNSDSEVVYGTKWEIYDGEIHFNKQKTKSRTFSFL